MAARRMILAMVVLLALAGCDTQPSAPTPNSATATPNPDAVWSLLNLDPNRLNGAMDIAMTGTDSAWVVGAPVTVYHSDGWAIHLQWAGGRWRITDSAVISATQAVAAAGEDNIWAVGSDLAHKDASGWHKMPLPLPSSYLRTVQLSADGQEGWAGGETIPQTGGNTCCPHIPLLLHYQNGTWQQVKVDGQGAIISLSVKGDEGWAVMEQTTDNVTGNENPPMLLHYHQGQWQPLANTDCPAGILCHAIPNSVYTVGADEAWAVGSYEADVKNHKLHFLLAHYKNGNWQEVAPSTLVGTLPNEQFESSSLGSVSFSDPDHGLAVGQQCSDVARPPDCMRRPLAFSYGNGQWQAQSVPSHKDELLTGMLTVSMSDPAHALAIDQFNYEIYAYGYGHQGDGTPTVLPPIVTAPPAGTPRLPYPTDTPGIEPTKLLKSAFTNIRRLTSYHIVVNDGSDLRADSDVARFDGTLYVRDKGGQWMEDTNGGHIWATSANADFENFVGEPAPMSSDPQLVGTEQLAGQTVSHYQIKTNDSRLDLNFWVGPGANGPLIYRLMSRGGLNLNVVYSEFNKYTSLQQLGTVIVPTPLPTPLPQPTDSGG